MEEHLPNVGISQVIRVLVEMRLADDVVEYRNESRLRVIGGNSRRTASRQSELSVSLGGPLERTRESRPYPISNVVDRDVDG
jgi:hypothetical protein